MDSSLRRCAVLGRAAVMTCLGCQVVAPSARAQGSTPLVTVSGLAFDSLAMRPLRGALVSIAGVGRTAFSDDKGRWRIDSVPEGTYAIALQHEAFDSLGLSGVSARVAVLRKGQRVVLAVPSFETMWRAACGDSRAPSDSALLYGTVRDAASRETRPNADVVVSWTDLTGGGASLTSIGQRQWKLASATDAHGEYALCGVAVGTRLTLRTTLDSLARSSIELDASVTRVRRLDVLVARPVAIAAAHRDVGSDTGAAPVTPLSAPTGSVAGTIVNAAGVPLAGAAVAIDTMAEVRSGVDGRFVVRDVPAGTRSLSVIAVGMAPYNAPITVLPRETTALLVPLRSVTELAKVNVTATTVANNRARVFEEHKRLGLGTFRDSTELGKHPSMYSALSSFPFVTIRGTPGRPILAAGRDCPSFRLVLDGHPAPVDVLGQVAPRDIAAVELYRRLYPSDLVIPGKCVLAVWTKAAMGK